MAVPSHQIRNIGHSKASFGLGYRQPGASDFLDRLSCLSRLLGLDETPCLTGELQSPVRWHCEELPRSTATRRHLLLRGMARLVDQAAGLDISWCIFLSGLLASPSHLIMTVTDYRPRREECLGGNAHAGQICFLYSYISWRPARYLESNEEKTPPSFSWVHLMIIVICF